MTNWAVIDVATTAVENVADYLDGEAYAAPSNYKDPLKIAEHIEGQKRAARQRAALDLDLGRLTMIGLMDAEHQRFMVCRTEDDERYALQELSEYLEGLPRLIGFNALLFDWPFVMRRGLYQGVRLSIDCDRYRSRHLDLWDLLSQHGRITARSLSFYIKRFGWTDLAKPLSGEEESAVPQTGRWDELRASVEHDLVATHRLAQKMGLL